MIIGLVQSYIPLFLNFTKENRAKVGVALVLMQSKSVGLIHIAFNCIIAKTYALIIAFNRRRLQSSVEYVQKSNRVILWSGSIVFGLILAFDIVMLIYYLLLDDDENDALEDFATFQLVGICLSGIVQVVLLIALPFMIKKLRKAMRMHKL